MTHKNLSAPYVVHEKPEVTDVSQWDNLKHFVRKEHRLVMFHEQDGRIPDYIHEFFRTFR